ncbi:50S ribosomal protein L11 methyltransferase [Streptomyces sp. M10(2022)]
MAAHPDGWQHHDGRATEDQWAATAYADRSVITRVGPYHADLTDPQDRPHGSPTSSATLPSLIVRMFQHARIADGDQLLDVGTGSGYGTALATLRLGEDHVTSIDVDQYLVAAARNRLDEIGLRPGVHALDGTGALPGVYDRIVATVGVRPVPASWLQALTVGGRLVTTISGTTLIVTAEKQPDGSAVGRVEWDRAGFMQARSDDDSAATLPAGLLDQAQHGAGEAVTVGPYPVVDLQEAWDLASMLDIDAPGTVSGHVARDDERTTWLAHPDGSWARATSYGSSPAGAPERPTKAVGSPGPGPIPLARTWRAAAAGARVRIRPDGETVLMRGGWHATLRHPA